VQDKLLAMPDKQPTASGHNRCRPDGAISFYGWYYATQWIKYQLVTGCNLSLASLACLLCNIRRETPCWISGLTMCGIKKPVDFDLSNTHAAMR